MADGTRRGASRRASISKGSYEVGCREKEPREAVRSMLPIVSALPTITPLGSIPRMENAVLDKGAFHRSAQHMFVRFQKDLSGDSSLNRAPCSQPHSIEGSIHYRQHLFSRLVVILAMSLLISAACGPSRQTGPLGMVFTDIPGASFDMGSAENGADAQPIHTVRLTPFQVTELEITRGQWRNLMKSDPIAIQDEPTAVEDLTWFEIQEFMGRLNDLADGWVYRLPTEAESEYLTRHRRLGLPKPFEWCLDFYSAQYFRTVRSGEVDPTGPMTGSHVVVRNTYSNGFVRMPFPPHLKWPLLGFRVVRQPRSSVGALPTRRTPNPGGVAVEVGPAGIEFVTVPPGEFRRWLTLLEERCANYWVNDTVTISTPFQLSRFQVTQRQWETIVPGRRNKFRGDNRPADSITWEDVDLLVTRLNSLNDGWKYGAPTAAEWEYAFQAGRYWGPEHVPWDDLLPRVRAPTYRLTQTHDVGFTKPNPWGLHEMVGHVQELVLDRGGYGPTSFGDHGRLFTPYHCDPVGVDPIGMYGDGHRVVGGGVQEFANAHVHSFREADDFSHAETMGTGETAFRLARWKLSRGLFSSWQLSRSVRQ